jgi:hypothetical protein
MTGPQWLEGDLPFKGFDELAGKSLTNQSMLTVVHYGEQSLGLALTIE